MRLAPRGRARLAGQLLGQPCAWAWPSPPLEELYVPANWLGIAGQRGRSAQTGLDLAGDGREGKRKTCGEGCGWPLMMPACPPPHLQAPYATMLSTIQIANFTMFECTEYDLVSLEQVRAQSLASLRPAPN